MLKVKLSKETKEKILKGLFATGEWISEVAEPISQDEGIDIFEPHIQAMLDAVDKAHDLIGNLPIQNE